MRTLVRRLGGLEVVGGLIVFAVLMGFAIGAVLQADFAAGTAALSALCVLGFVWLIFRRQVLGQQRLHNQLEMVQRISRETRSLVNVRPLIGPIPLEFDDWAVDPVMAELLIRLIEEHEPKLVFECGSGASTAIIASCLNELGQGQVISLEHDPDFAGKSRRLIARRKLDHRATVITAPLTTQLVEETEVLWYAPEPTELLTSGIDLLVVDGPPGQDGVESRFPAVPILRPLLNPETVIVLDDGDRLEERRTAHRWSIDLPSSLEYVATTRGAWVLQVVPREPSAHALGPTST